MKRCKKCGVPLEGALGKILKLALKVSPSEKDASIGNKCETSAGTGTYTCQICNRAIEEGVALTHIKTEEYLLDLIKKDHPEWNEKKGACPKCVDYYRELIKKAKI